MNCNVGGLNINYIDEGTGPVILLLHGWGSSVDVWNRIIADFSNKFRLIAVDFPGFGKSDMPPIPWSVEDYAVFTLKFMNTVGIINPIMMGHSFGGRVIIKLSGTGRVAPKKIVLIDAAGVKPKKSFRSKMRIAAFKTVKGALTLPIIKNHTEHLLAKARNHFGSADYNSAPEVLRKTLVMVVNEDLTCHMPSIQASALLIYGENDTATPVADAKLIESLIQGSGLCIIKGAGHFSFIEKPYEVHAILHSFLG